MNRTSKLALAAILFATAVTAFPRHAAASTAVTTVAAPADGKGGSTDEKHKDWSEVIATAMSVIGLVF